MTTTTCPAMKFDHDTCTDCGYQAGEGNGWFGTDSRCLDCRDHADRTENGWTAENSTD